MGGERKAGLSLYVLPSLGLRRGIFRLTSLYRTAHHMAASTAAIASAANAMDQGREGANHPVGLVNASDSSINMEPGSDRKVDPTRSERPAPRLGQTAAAAAGGSRSSSGSFSSRVQPSLATKHNSEWNLQEAIPTVRSERKCCFCCGHRWVFCRGVAPPCAFGGG